MGKKLTEIEMHQWYVDKEYWRRNRKTQELEFDRSRLPTQPQKSPQKSPQNSADRTWKRCGKYHTADFKSLRDWNSFRTDEKTLSRLQSPLIFRREGEKFSVVIIFSLEVDVIPIERRLFGEEKNWIKPEKDLKTLTRKINQQLETNLVKRSPQPTGERNFEERKQLDQMPVNKDSEEITFGASGIQNFTELKLATQKNKRSRNEFSISGSKIMRQSQGKFFFFISLNSFRFI